MQKNVTRFFNIWLAVALAVPLFAQVERREAGNLILENIPDIPQQVVERMLQYQNVRSAGFTGWHPEGKGLYVVTRFGETSQILKNRVTFF
ncbi:MAG: hypothetical protein GH143_03290, partial [Calditrichaeota bacterium]|nr:hypothetical protein [Calditrichota bacterium]